MKCTECGREIGDNQKFCKYCGAPVKQVVSFAESTSQVKKCRGCGAILKPGTAFCTQCGIPVSDAEVKVSTTKEGNKPQGGKAGKIIIAVITIIVLVLVAFVGYYFADQYGVFNRDTKEPTSEVTGDNEPVYEEVKPTETVPSEATEPEEPTVTVNSDVIDVEATVLQIRDKYDKIVNGISSNSYDITLVDEGVMAYSERNQIKAIVVKKDYGGYGYVRNFYYDGDKLFFAYYEGPDSHRLYFNEDKLIRWRYCPDAVDNGKATNYDMETTTSYLQWEQRVKDDAFYLENKWRDVFDTRNNVPQINIANIRDADATSYLDESKYNIVHLPERAIDGDLETGWAEGASGQGIGESITVYFDRMYLVSGIEIYAGYQRNNDLYNKNSRPKEVYVEFSDGSGESYILKDMNDVQNMKFANSVITDSITLRIDSVYPGNKYEDTVITEISPY